MMRQIRKFTMDKEHIYFVNDGIITRKSIIELLNDDGIYEKLDNSSDNVGWCDCQSALMFTGDNRVLRVDIDVLINMMLHPTTLAMQTKEPGISVFEYESQIYTDSMLKANNSYKNFEKLKGKNLARKIGKIPKESKKVGFKKCIMIQDPLSIYFAYGDGIFRTPILEYIASHGSGWKTSLAESDYHTGYILGDKGVLLRVTEDKIERISDEKREFLIRHGSTKVDVRTSSLYDYIIVEYDCMAFPDGELRVTTMYKK